MTKWMRLLSVSLIVVACVGCDQATKAMAKSHLSGTEARTFLDGAVRLQYAENSGAFLGLGASLPAPVRTALFTVAVAAFVGFVLLYSFLSASMSRYTRVALALLCGGGIGNLLDRLLHDGRVVDFMNVGFGAVRSGIFNLADVAIMAGALLYALSELRRKNPR